MFENHFFPIVCLVELTFFYRSVHEVLPKKKVIRQYLYEKKINLSYKKVIQTYEACWNNEDTPLPAGVQAHDVYQLKTILEANRKKTGALSKTALLLESNLIEKAAEMGDNMAITLLCGRTLNDEKASEEDKSYAVKLLDDLCEIQFGPAFKIKGDIAYKHGHISKAEDLYQDCLDANLSQELNSVKIECLRSIGVIRFNNYDLEQAKLYFQLAIAEAEQPSQVMDCHFYLSQILEEDKDRARYHLEQAARFGLKQSFAPLGFLLMNYFNRPDLAVEWFDLGNSIGDFNSIVGLFDVSIKQKKYDVARKAFENIEKLTPDEDTLSHFKKSRRLGLEALQLQNSTLVSTDAAPEENPKGRWDF